MDTGLYEPSRGGGVPSTVAGTVTGLLALFSGLAIAELVAGLVRDAPSPVVAVGDAMIDLSPGALSDWAIDTFGTANKTVLLSGTLVVLAVLGAVGGVLALRGRRGLAVTVAVVVAALGILAIVT
ncbi:MAG: hypothetical protein WD225_02645, partial [Ilumatobacteraceae bacterium]